MSGAAPAVRKRREQAASSARAPKMPVSVANSSQVGGLSVCRRAAWMLAFGCKDGNRSSAPTRAELQLIAISTPSRAMMTVTQVSLVCVGRSVHETSLRCVHAGLKAHVPTFTKAQLFHRKLVPCNQPPGNWSHQVEFGPGFS